MIYVREREGAAAPSLKGLKRGFDGSSSAGGRKQSRD